MNKLMNCKKETFAAAVCGILVLFILLLTATETLCFRIPGWWRSEYTKYNTPQYVRGEMSMDDAVYVTEQMLEYCIGRLDSLDNVNATIDGRTAPFFTEREKQHLSDCRNLFLAAVKARVIALVLLAVLLAAIYYSIRKKNISYCSDAPAQDSAAQGISGPKENKLISFPRVLARGYLYALGVVIAIALIIAALSVHDFTFVFTEFHHIFFDNDLWILYPDQDNLINIMQEAVFADAALTIACMWAAAAAVLAVVSSLVLRRKGLTTRHI